MSTNYIFVHLLDNKVFVIDARCKIEDSHSKSLLFFIIIVIGSHDTDELYATEFLSFVNICLMMAYSGRN